MKCDRPESVLERYRREHGIMPKAPVPERNDDAGEHEIVPKHVTRMKQSEAFQTFSALYQVADDLYALSNDGVLYVRRFDTDNGVSYWKLYDLEIEVEGEVVP